MLKTFNNLSFLAEASDSAMLDSEFDSELLASNVNTEENIVNKKILHNQLKQQAIFFLVSDILR